LSRRIGGPFRERRLNITDVAASNGDRKTIDMNHALSEAALPRGFRFAATACGLKKTGALDLAILSSDAPASAAAVFTQNLVVAAPVLISKAHLRASKGRMRAVVVNAGNANCGTGAAGHAAADDDDELETLSDDGEPTPAHELDSDSDELETLDAESDDELEPVGLDDEPALPKAGGHALKDDDELEVLSSGDNESGTNIDDLDAEIGEHLGADPLEGMDDSTAGEITLDDEKPKRRSK